MYFLYYGVTEGDVGKRVGSHCFRNHRVGWIRNKLAAHDRNPSITLVETHRSLFFSYIKKKKNPLEGSPGLAQESHKHSRPGFSFLSAPPCLAENLTLSALSWSNNDCRSSGHRDPIPVNRKEESGSYRKGSSRTPTQPLEGRLRNVTYRSVPRVPLVKKGVGAGWMPTGLCCVWPRGRVA